MNELTHKISAHFKRHKEHAFILKAFVTIAIVLSLQEYLFKYLIFALFVLLPIFFISGVLALSAATGEGILDIVRRNITLLPAVYSDEKSRTEKRPWVTYGLVLVNVAIFYLFQNSPLLDTRFISDNLVFLPHDPNFWNVPVSLFTWMFLHGSNAHLWGNMFFLWGVGSEVEKRTGSGKFAFLYFMTGIFSGLLFISMRYVFLGQTGHVLGASGAIAGIMGVFAVRCYFKKMVFPIPILGFLPISFKMRMNSLVMMGLFFMMDLKAGMEVISGEGFSNVAHWAHLGGMISGIVIAGMMKMSNEAIEERHTEIGLERLKEGVGLGEGEESLRTVIDRNEANIDALLALARLKSRRRGLSYDLSDEGAELYRKAVKLLIKSDQKLAADVFKEYYNKYQQGVDASLQFRIAGVLYRRGDLNLAGRALEMLIEGDETPTDIMEKALFQAAKVMEEMELADVARGYYDKFLETFPDSTLASRVREKLNA